MKMLAVFGRYVMLVMFGNCCGTVGIYDTAIIGMIGSAILFLLTFPLESIAEEMNREK